MITAFVVRFIVIIFPFVTDSSLILNLTRRQGLKIRKMDLEVLEILIFHEFSSTLAGGGSLLSPRSSKLSTSHP